MSFSEKKGLWLSLVAAAIIVGTFAWIFVFTEPFRLVVLYSDVGNLKKNDPIVWKDFTIGRVEKIEPLVENKIGVTVRLNEDYATRITRGTEFHIRKASLFGLVGSNAIEIVPPSIAGAPYDSGEVIQGIDAPDTTLVEEGKRLTLEYWQKIKSETLQLMAELRESPYRREAEEALNQLKVLAEEGMQQTKETLEKFHAEHKEEFDRITTQLQALREQMLKTGDRSGARRVEEKIEELKKSSPQK